MLYVRGYWEEALGSGEDFILSHPKFKNSANGGRHGQRQFWILNEGYGCHTLSGGALPPGARANEMRKDRPNQVYRAVLGIKLSPRIVCALGESAPPPGALGQ